VLIPNAEIFPALAEFATGVAGNVERLPAPVADLCRDVMINAAAAALAGAAQPDGIALGRLVREMGGNGRCTIIGMGMRTSPVYAALVNGSLVRILDFDDQAADTGYNVTAAVFPTVLALGEMHGIPGPVTLSAFATGCEIACRLAASQTTVAMAGTAGAAAAAGAMLGLDAGRLTNAIALSAAMASQQSDQDGPGAAAIATGGSAAMNGVLAALIANEGVVAYRSEREAATTPATSAQFGDQLRNIGTEWRLLDPGIALRVYPCNPASHCVIDAVLGLTQLHRIELDQVSNVHVGVSATTLAQTPEVIPENPWQARSCLAFIAAATLCHGQPLINFFSDPAIQDEGVRAMMSRVSVEASLPPSARSGHPAEVRVTLRDGRTLQHRVDHARGTPGLPLDAEELEAKFLYCTRYILPADHIDEAINSFRNIENIDNVTGMVSVLGG
jgi:2-methylcitrate dehydratase PrpD